MPEPMIVPVLSKSLLLLLMMPLGPRSISPALSVMTLKVSAPPVLRMMAPAALLTRLRVIDSPKSDSISARLMVLLNEIPTEPPVPTPLPVMVKPAPRVVVTADEPLFPTKLLAPANKIVPLPPIVCVLRLTRLELDVRLTVRPVLITKPLLSASAPSFDDSVRLAGTTRSMSSNTSVNVLLAVITRLPTLPLRCSVPPVIVPPCRFTTPVVSLNTNVWPVLSKLPVRLIAPAPILFTVPSWLNVPARFIVPPLARKIPPVLSRLVTVMVSPASATISA